MDSSGTLTRRSWFTLLLVVAAPLAYYGLVLAYSVNVPIYDDYVLLKGTNDLLAATSLTEKLTGLFAMHTDYRIVTTRAIMFLWAKLTGSVDFKALNIVGNCALLPAAVVLGRSIGLGEDRKRWALFFLVSFQTQYLKLMFYPMAALQAFVGLLFSLLHLRYALEERKWFLSPVCYLLAVVTSGSGLFLSGITVPLLVYRRHYRRAGVLAAVTVATVALYAPSSGKLAYPLAHPFRVLQFFALLLGNPAELPFFRSAAAQLSLALSLGGYFLYFLRAERLNLSRPGNRQKLATVACLLYLLLMIALIAVGRAETYQGTLPQAALDGRYRIYSLLFLAVCLSDLVHRVDARGGWRSRLPGALITCALLLNVLWCIPSFFSIRVDSRARVEAVRRWAATGQAGALPTGASPPEEAAETLAAAIRMGYRPQQNF